MVRGQYELDNQGTAYGRHIVRAGHGADRHALWYAKVSLVDPFQTTMMRFWGMRSVPVDVHLGKLRCMSIKVLLGILKANLTLGTSF